MSEDKVRIWSNKRGMWWVQSRHGYTDDIKLAGLFDREEAEEICSAPFSPSEIKELNDE